MADEENQDIDALRQKLKIMSTELHQIKKVLEKKGICWNEEIENGTGSYVHLASAPISKKLKLSNKEILRYSRQLILPEVGVQGQLNLGSTSVLIVGAGGLGCPVALYLVAAGIGRVGLVDYDDVELNNLHRQVLHSELKVHWNKVYSAKAVLSRLNSTVEIIPYKLHLNSSNAQDLIRNYDIIVDATDNVPTRYLINDVCVLEKKPLVSGSALRFDGQLTVYGYDNGPCYRCLYPSPPPPETVGNCSESGVLGVVPGIIGNLQALEVIKIATGLPGILAEESELPYSNYLQVKPYQAEIVLGWMTVLEYFRALEFDYMLLFDGLESRFTTIKLRGRQKDCLVCGENPTINRLQDYEQFCGAAASDKIKDLDVLPSCDRISAQAYKKLVDDQVLHILVDVRPEVETEICRLLTTKHSINIPIGELKNCKNATRIKEVILAMIEKHFSGQTVPVIAVCHHGNDSQKAVPVLKKLLKEFDVSVKDIQGGLHDWSENIDPDFPQY